MVLGLMYLFFIGCVDPTEGSKSTRPDDQDSDGFSEADGDCADDDGAIHPGAADDFGDDVDQDCDGSDGVDGDGDGFASKESGGTDCDDGDSELFPGLVDEGADSECLWDEDGDGFGSMSPPEGFDPGTDCNDSDTSEYPGSAINENRSDCCIDSDGDGYGEPDPPAPYDPGLDCDDSDADTFPGAVDEGTPWECMLDADGDGLGDDSPPGGYDPGTDCDDTDPSTPDDRDCDGLVAMDDCDDSDPGWGDRSTDMDCDGFSSDVDCDDQDWLERPMLDLDSDGTAETCAQFVHNDYPFSFCFAEQGEAVRCRSIGGSTSLSSAPSTPLASVSLGTEAACGIDADGALQCWGSDAWGLISGAPSGSWQDVSLGSTGACAVAIDGSVACWGASDGSWYGLEPVPEGPFLDVEVSSSDDYACGIKLDRSIECWSSYSSVDPEVLSDMPEGEFHKLALQGGRACALDGDGMAGCWGAGGSYGILSNVPSTAFVSISLSELRACGLRPDGQLECWGRDVEATEGLWAGVSGSYNELCFLERSGSVQCNRTEELHLTPAPSGTFSAVDVGLFGGCVKDSDGYLQCWGPLGVEDMPQVEKPLEKWELSDDCLVGLVASGHSDAGTVFHHGSCPSYGIAPTGSNYVEIAAGEYHGCALDEQGQIDCWGATSYYVDDGQVSDAPTGSGYTHLALGTDFSCSAPGHAGGAVHCWGDTFGLIDPFDDIPPVSSISSYGGSDYFCYIDTAGFLGCSTCYSGSFCQPPGGLWEQLDLGRGGCARDSSNHVQCWGSQDSPALEQLFVDIGVGESSACGITEDGRAECWGPYMKLFMADSY